MALRARSRARSASQWEIWEDAVLADDSPDAVWLLTGDATRHLGTALNVNRLDEPGAAEAVRVVIIGVDVDCPAATTFRVAPLIWPIELAAIKGAVIGTIVVTPVITVEIARQGSANGSADDYARDGSAGIAAAGLIAEQSANYGADNSARRIHSARALAVISVVISGVNARIALLPKLIAINPGIISIVAVTTAVSFITPVLLVAIVPLVPAIIAVEIVIPLILPVGIVVSLILPVLRLIL